MSYFIGESTLDLLDSIDTTIASPDLPGVSPPLLSDNSVVGGSSISSVDTVAPREIHFRLDNSEWCSAEGNEPQVEDQSGEAG